MNRLSAQKSREQHAARLRQMEADLRTCYARFKQIAEMARLADGDRNRPDLAEAAVTTIHNLADIMIVRLGAYEAPVEQPPPAVSDDDDDDDGEEEREKERGKKRKHAKK